MPDAEEQVEQEKESKKDRLEREHRELLEELRALIPGAEVLFGFLLAICFTSPFKNLNGELLHIYYVTLVSTGVALVLFLAPAAHHRIRFREGDKEFMLRKANLEAIGGSIATAIAFTGVIFIVTDLAFGRGQAIAASAVMFLFTAWRWWAVALYRAINER